MGVHLSKGRGAKKWIFMGSILLLSSVHAMDISSLQRGSQIFINNCYGCHSIKYMHSSILIEDLQMKPLLPLGHMKTILSPKDAKKWFRNIPPDLSLIIREKGAPWLRDFLNGFYADSNQPGGFNNVVVPNVSMPPVFLGESVKEKEKNIDDLICFLTYVSEPAKLVRYNMGIKVLSFLFLFLVLIWCIHPRYFALFKVSR